MLVLIVVVRHAWRIPNTTHRYLIESISGSLHPMVMLASRYIGFVKTLLTSTKYCIRVMASSLMRDMRTVMGKTITKISAECSSTIVSLTPRLVKESMKYFGVPAEEEWRIGPLREILSDSFEVPGFSVQEIDEIKSHLCTT